MSALHYINMLSWYFSVLVHYNNSLESRHVAPLWQSRHVAPLWQSRHVAPLWQNRHIAPHWQSRHVAPLWQNRHVAPLWQSRHVAPLWHIKLILSQQVFDLTHKCCILRREATNTNIIVFSLTQPGLKSTIYHSWGKLANHFITDAVNMSSEHTHRQ
jgi:hypothetical protein